MNTTITDLTEKTIIRNSYTTTYTLNQNEGLIIFLLEGKARVKLNGYLFYMSPGSFIVCKNGDRLSIQFSKRKTNRIFTVEFSSTDSVIYNLLQKFKLNSYCCYDIDIITREYKILKEEYIINSELFREASSLFLGRLLYSLLLTSFKASESDKETLRLAKDIHSNFANGKFNVEDYSGRVNLSRDRFSVIFKNRFLHPPYKYQTILKIKEAERLLKRTTLPIKKIAEITGFSNQLHFCNIYKKHMGNSPSETRKNAN